MRKYYSFFRLLFSMGLQYRAAAIAGVSTQFAWGFLEIMVFHAFYQTGADAFPMAFNEVVSYIWLQQAFFTLFNTWMVENSVLDSIQNGNIAYELCRPVHLYHMWFARNTAARMSHAMLRFIPILVIVPFLPSPFGMKPPASPVHFALFLLAMVLGLGVTIAFTMLIYFLTFFTLSPQGLRIFFVSAVEFLSGAIIPLPFLPPGLQRILELLPFASMQNVALRIYSASMTDTEMAKALVLQFFWLTALIALGHALCGLAEKKVIIQGG